LGSILKMEKIKGGFYSGVLCSSAHQSPSPPSPIYRSICHLGSLTVSSSPLPLKRGRKNHSHRHQRKHHHIRQQRLHRKTRDQRGDHKNPLLPQIQENTVKNPQQTTTKKTIRKIQRTRTTQDQGNLLQGRQKDNQQGQRNRRNNNHNGRHQTPQQKKQRLQRTKRTTTPLVIQKIPTNTRIPGKTPRTQRKIHQPSIHINPMPSMRKQTNPKQTQNKKMHKMRPRRRQRHNSSKKPGKTLPRRIQEHQKPNPLQINVGSPRSPRKPPNEKEGGRAKNPERP